MLRTNLILMLIPCFVFCIAGCGSSNVGLYVSEIRIRPGIGDQEHYSLEIARGEHGKLGETLELLSGGRFERRNVLQQNEGDWWVEDGRIAFRSTHQNGQKIGLGVPEGADSYLDIDSDGNLVRFWDSEDTLLDVVYVKQ